jgi:CDP-Glycerol:Poly(glycerophosphate) glycerophosphotransferase
MSEPIAARVGFIGWNPFQLNHVRGLVEAMPGACFVLERRKNHIEQFPPELLGEFSAPVLVWERDKIAQLDGAFDVLVCQTPFSGIESFKKTRIAMIQYGYAKEAHNYGPWRSFAELTLTYGEYAAEKIAHFCPVAATGNPRYDDWHQADFHHRARQRHALDPNKATLLYAPTWGKNSSVEQYLGPICQLATDYNVLVKTHHNTELLEAERRDGLDFASVRHLGASADLLELLSVADLVISDFSGAIFEALYCQKPLVLVGQPNELDEKVDRFSLERSHREQLGLVVHHPGELPAGIQEALAAKNALVERNEVLRGRLFNLEPGATQRAVEALEGLSRGEWVPTQLQGYIRKEMSALYRAQAQLAERSRMAPEPQPTALSAGLSPAPILS